ncbi:MAG: hypothetical protein A2539_09300 [Elusimicrobia bacterium RIFOXYD2_FULL_34_15]|nr:MAG: hypothetical protein A2539_09300 [Elusimicrobia bacterium RIFOXYD2_FULL_34_15]
MKKVFYLAVIILTIVTFANAVSISENAGTTTGEFLRIGAGARPAGMGEAFASVADDVYSLYWNPAGLSKVTQKQALLAHTFWYEDVSHEYASYVHPLSDNKGTAGISVTYLSTTYEKRAGDTEEPDSNASIGDLAVGLSYGRKTYYDIDAGITLKFISSDLDTESASGFGVDLGFQRVCPFWEKMDMGLAISNIGGSLKYVDESVAVGKILDLGLSVKDAYFKHLTVATDLRTLTNFSTPSVNLGAEYNWIITDKFSFIPRAGFKTYLSQITAGFGIGWKSYQLDYAFISHTDLSSNNRISLNAKF